jgi:hypothetical protein
MILNKITAITATRKVCVVRYLLNTSYFVRIANIKILQE